MQLCLLYTFFSKQFLLTQHILVHYFQKIYVYAHFIRVCAFFIFYFTHHWTGGLHCKIQKIQKIWISERDCKPHSTNTLEQWFSKCGSRPLWGDQHGDRRPGGRCGDPPRGGCHIPPPGMTPGVDCSYRPLPMPLYPWSSVCLLLLLKMWEPHAQNGSNPTYH